MRNQSSDTLFGLYDLFVGGAFSNAAIFALGIMPYISASIIIQLLGAVIPFFQKLQKEGETGRKKINQYTRFGTVVIRLLQAWGVSVRLASLNANGVPIVPAEVQGFFFAFSTMIFLTAGTMFMMWLGEQITERGLATVSRLSSSSVSSLASRTQCLMNLTLVSSGARPIIIELDHLGLDALIVAGVIMVTQGTRGSRCSMQNGLSGRKVYGGVTQYIPMRVNTAGCYADHFRTIIDVHPEHDPDILPRK
jgi:preprotein translocase subunit SecY